MNRIQKEFKDAGHRVVYFVLLDKTQRTVEVTRWDSETKQSVDIAKLPLDGVGDASRHPDIDKAIEMARLLAQTYPDRRERHEEEQT